MTTPLAEARRVVIVMHLALGAAIVTVGAVVGAIITIIVLEHWRLLNAERFFCMSIAYVTCGITTAQLR
jgi:hypothetical protein